MNPATTQSLFFQHLKSYVPPHKALVEEVADLLGISTDSAYRRIRGEKPLGLSELQQLAAHYKVSLDQLLNLQSDAVLFTGKPAAHAPVTLDSWLTRMLGQLQLMNSFGRRHLYYLLKDIPPFYHFQIPELTEFKMFFWMKSILHYDSLKGVQFRFGDPQYENSHALCQRIVALYSEMPTTEIWNAESVNSTLRQIEFYHQAGAFASPDDARLLYEKVAELLDAIEYQAEVGVKCIMKQPGSSRLSYRLFVNELILGDNTLLVELDDIRLTYLNHSVLHFLGTRDEEFNDFMFANLDNLMKKSTLISGVGEKERSQFFNAMRQNIHHRARML
ncbi:helix-turn-helix domain-containing protein [uncultured Hymenobacter sp.]|uniref:helix-turn-helix domain-containing protein n=1 Tax=uncultured Hymenobacter sp. TaxID=170016 RepID=UPI0035CC4F17